MSHPLLSFGVTKSFEGFTLDCEATFDSGVTAIFGPSGSGKTTLLNCIAGLLTPDEGEVEVLGRTVYSSSAGINVAPEKRRFGYVFQDSALFPHMTVRENIMYGYKLTPHRYRQTEPDQLVELFQLSHLLDRNVTNLSGGERQRVALARALATSPDMLLLDEPLASLDIGFRGKILEHLKRVWRELETPMVYVSHSLSEVMALADTALIISEGRQVVHGKASHVLVHPDVIEIADYASLKNILQAQVVSTGSGDGLADVRVGGARLVAPDVYRQPGDDVMISIRAGDIILALDVPPRLSAQNVISASIEEIHVIRSRVLVYLGIGVPLVAEITPNALRELDLREGQQVYVIIKTNSIVALDTPDEILS